MQLNLDFNGFFLRAFTGTQREKGVNPFFADLRLPYLPFWPGVTPPPGSPSITGTATLVDILGNPITTTTITNSFLDGGPSFQPDIGFLALPDFPVTPVDIYGIHFDLQLSDSPGKLFAGPTPDEITFRGFFGVGPGRIPRDTVPDAGSTIALFLCGLVVCAAFNRRAKAA